MSAWDSQGGPSPSPCPGVSGLSRFTPLPSTVHPPRILSRVSTPPVPSVPRRNHRDAASSSCSVTCPKLLLRSPLSCACPLPLPLSQPRSVLLFPEHPQGLGARRLTPTSPILQTRGRSGAECVPLGGHGAIACGVRSRCPSPALSDPLTTRRKAPNSAPGGGPCSGQTSHSRVSAGAPGARRLPDAGAALPVCPGGQKPKHKTEGIL